ncbi:S8 family serine peptidase [Hydrogenothermus marinus]|uniref:Subtilase family protein n=1 Tax=Hydrogenothermus marinus TaxID=133270 RepID=A0A3M0B6R8_9AQUI|nr:S8 family serine peptidase [Hydrogenothermus marinus]RMA93100.1 subtilase family protein [Hydrogenothermus marinus]
MLNYANTSTLILLAFFIFSFGKPYKNEVIVYLKSNISTQSIKGLSIVSKKGKKVVIKLPKNETMESFIQKLKKDENVLLAIPNYIIKKQLIPNDPFYPYQWYLKKIGMEDAWNISIGSNTVYVAVLDTGVDYNHPDLKEHIWLNTGETLGQDLNNNGIDDGCEDNIDNDNNGYIDDCYGYDALQGKGSALDNDGHGTHVSGIIGAVSDNLEGIAGINWNIKIIPCKFLNKNGEGDLNHLIECLKYVKKLKDSGLNIVAVNASYGYDAIPEILNIDCNNPDYSETEKCLMKSINAVFTVAAGNSSNNNDISTFLPCNYSTVLDNVICVGATNRQDKRAYFSNYGVKTVDIFAPGGEFVSSENCSEGILSTYLPFNNSYEEAYACAVGTSQASPVVAGAVALLYSINPNLTPKQVKDKVLTTGDNIISLSGYSLSCNRVNVYNLLKDEINPKICIDKPINEEDGNYSYYFGNFNIGKIKDITFNIKNSGNDILSIGNITLKNNPYFQIIFDNCSNRNLNTFESCSLTLRFSASSTGIKVSILNIPNNTYYQNLEINLRADVYDNRGGGGGGCSFSKNNFNIAWFLFILLIILKRKVIKWKNLY